MKQLLLVLFLTFWCTQLQAQEYVVDLKHWDVKDGISHRRINYLFEDRDGMIWLSTQRSITRFDGYQFVNYPFEKISNRIVQVSSIAQDAQNNLWLCGYNNAIAIFDPLSLEAKPAEQLLGHVINNPEIVATLADSSIFISIVDSGNIFYSWLPSRGLRRIEIPAPYRFIAVMNKGNCLLAASDQGTVAMLDLNARVMKTSTVPFSRGIPVIAGQTTGIYMRDSARLHYYYVSPNLDVADITGAFVPIQHGRSLDIYNVGPDSLVWRHEKLFAPRNKVVHDFHDDKVLAYGKFARHTIQDRKGNVWIGNEMGLNRLSARKNKFRQYLITPSGTLEDNSCRGIYATGNKLYVRNEFNGLFCIDLRSSVSRLVLPGTGFLVQKVTNGMLTGSICNIDDNESIKCFDIHSNYHFECWSACELDTKHYLLGMSSGLLYFNYETGVSVPFIQYNNYPELASATILYIHSYKKGKAWICCNSGFYEYDSNRGIVARYSSADSGDYRLPASGFQHYSQDDAGIYWLATTSGLIRWDKAKHTSRLYTVADGLTNNNIYAVYSDDRNNVWMSSDYGITRMDKTTGKMNTYTVEDGLGNNEFNRVSHFKDSNGCIYFGSLRGVTAFDPHDFSISGDADKSSLVITSFMQFNGQTNKLEDKRKTLAAGNEIVMNPNDRFFTLEFALLNYTDPQKTTYYWKIDDKDTAWNAQNDRTLHFSRLPFGMHTLRIKARGADGCAAQNEIAIKINVIRPFYMRIGFIIAVLLIVCGMIIAGYRWRVYLLQKENARLDTVVREKTEDLRRSLQQKEILLKEIHHRVKNNLQVISSMLRLQSQQVTDTSAREALLEGKNRVLSIALVHQKLYQDDQLEGVNLNTFVNELFTRLGQLFNSLHVSLINELPGAHFNINTAVPLGLILNELFTNSFKYAFENVENPTIWISLEQKGEECKLTFSDNGPGLEKEISTDRPKSLGISLVQMLSKQLHGRMTYSNNVRSTFIITFRE